MSLDDDNNEINNSKKIFLINILKNLRMKKILFCSALAAVALASCSSDDFMGDTSGSTPSSANSAIKFDGNAGKITRATSNSGTPAVMLDGQFKIYGVKANGTDGAYTDVFQNYFVWDNTAGSTTSNTNGWEYVGEKNANNLGTGNITLSNAQTIKYWDYASKDYHFVAGSPISAFTYKLKNDTKDIESATITGLGGHITANTTGTANTFNPVYVAEPKVVAKADYQKPVQFEFVRQQSMVRVGIYETIPGYKIKEITFYKQGNNGLEVDNTHNIILTSATPDYFVGGSNVTGTITYDWTSSTKPTYSLAYTATELTKSKNWYGGALAHGVKATTSTETTIANLYGTDQDMADNGYFTVLSTVAGTTANSILIKCDYTLESEDNSGETIKVTGATAAIPAAYSKWEVNTRYTYLFKISENTNGYTGSDPDKTGLYPITFDAVVKDTKLGTITTFTTPSITTYQEGSVVENGGIKYVANTAIKVKIADSANGTDLNLNQTENTVGHVAVYKLTKERTEADLQLASVSRTEFTEGNKQTISLGDESKSFTFTPTEAGWYAIQYLTTAATAGTPAAYTYKVVKVE